MRGEERRGEGRRGEERRDEMTGEGRGKERIGGGRREEERREHLRVTLCHTVLVRLRDAIFKTSGHFSEQYFSREQFVVSGCSSCLVGLTVKVNQQVEFLFHPK